jgi:prepilin-type processing-associated H-X9-DG protein
MRAKRRTALTLLEVLVVITIVGLLTGLLLPAVQQARAAARRTECLNNLRQIGLALLQEESAHGSFPPGSVSHPCYHSWVPFILPFLEQQALADQYQWAVSWDNPANDPVITSPLRVMVCPAAPSGRVGYTRPGADLGRGVGDYSAINDVAPGNVFLSSPPAPDPTRLGVLRHDVRTRMTDIIDGTSSTLMVAESAGRPQVWQAGQFLGNIVNPFCAWANPFREIQLTGSSPDGSITPGPCAINCTNNLQVYAFHAGGANFLFADGSSRLIRASIDLNVLSALVTRAAGETVSPADY